MKNDFLGEASRLAIEAGHLVMSLRSASISSNRKSDNSLVTEADLRSDELLRAGLSQSFPKHTILSEENGLSGPVDSEWMWMIDPLDGTRAYAKGIVGFSVMVGLLKNKKPYLGVVVDPVRDLVYEAVHAEGAFLTSKGIKTPLKVSDRKEFAQMPLVLSTGCSDDLKKKLQESLALPLYAPINSVGIKIGLLVRKEADVYFSHHPIHEWDACAPQVILEEAGGRMTLVTGAPLDYDTQGRDFGRSLILASNGRRHRELTDFFRLTPPV